MLVVKVELHHAVTGVETELGSLSICNDGTSDDRRLGNYEAELRARLPNGGGTLVLPGIRVESHERTQHVWKLVQAVLNAALRGER